MKYLFILVCLFAGITSISCKEKSKTASNAEVMNSQNDLKANLIDGRWQVNYLAGTPKPLDSMYPKMKPTMIINTEKEQISGTTGCNNFSGKLSINGNEFNLGDAIALTKKMCPDMSGEDTFMKTLERVNTYSVTERGQTLNLISGDIAIMRLERVQE